MNDRIEESEIDCESVHVRDKLMINKTEKPLQDVNIDFCLSLVQCVTQNKTLIPNVRCACVSARVTSCVCPAFSGEQVGARLCLSVRLKLALCCH